MPADLTVHRALTRSRCTILFLVLSVLVAPLASHAQSNLDGIELDRQLADQYAVPTPAGPQVPVHAPVNGLAAEPTVAQVLDEAAMARLEAEIDAALAEDENVRPLITEAPVSLLQTLLLVLAGLCLLAFAGVVLTLALRELRKDKQLRRRTYRRRVKRRSVTDTVATA